MTGFFFVLGELIRALRQKGGGFIFLAILFVFLFLAVFSGLFLVGGPGQGTDAPRPLGGKILVHLTPGLSPQAIQALYIQLLEEREAERVNVLAGDALAPGGATLQVQATSPAAGRTLVEKLKTTPGIASVDYASAKRGLSLPVSSSLRLGLLLGLAASAVGSLFFARLGFRGLLGAFAEEIKLMRVSGLSEAMILGPIVVAGVLFGLTGSLFLIAAVNLAHVGLAAHPQAVPPLVAGILEATRVQAVSLLSIPLGFLMGAFFGSLGASLAGSRELQP